MLAQIPDDATITARGLSGGQIMASPDGRVLGSIAQLAATGDLEVDLFRVVSLEDAAAALAEIEAGRVHENIVVDLALKRESRTRTV
jgi:hypothetical protein